MKVLLILSNQYLHRAIRQAVLIWIATCLGGCVALYAFQFLLFSPIESFILSLVFSSPALLIAIPFLYHLTALPGIVIRVISALSIIILTSGAIIGFVAVFFKLRYAEVAESLLLFIPAALVCFVLIARKQIVSKQISYK